MKSMTSETAAAAAAAAAMVARLTGANRRASQMQAQAGDSATEGIIETQQGDPVEKSPKPRPVTRQPYRRR